MQEVIKYRHCFVCGDLNHHGLKARFYYDGREAYTDVIALEDFEGYRGIYHGGIISTLLDEVMIKAILAGGVFAVTAEITVRFHKPVSTGTRLHFIGRIASSRGRIYLTEGEVVDTEGNCYASASGKYLVATDKLKARLAESLD